jgi:hypothetical protein
VTQGLLKYLHKVILLYRTGYRRDGESSVFVKLFYFTVQHRVELIFVKILNVWRFYVNFSKYGNFFYKNLCILKLINKLECKYRLGRQPKLEVAAKLVWLHNETEQNVHVYV